MSAVDVRRFVGLPADGYPQGTRWARPAGRRLAMHPVLARPPTQGLDVVLDALTQAQRLLVAIGVRVDVVRIRRGCAVVRATPLEGMRRGSACEVSRGLLETIPAMARGIRGTVVETTCCERGADACLYTLLWDATFGALALFRPFRHEVEGSGSAGTFVLGAGLEGRPDDGVGPGQQPPGRGLDGKGGT